METIGFLIALIGFALGAAGMPGKPPLFMLGLSLCGVGLMIGSGRFHIGLFIFLLLLGTCGLIGLAVSAKHSGTTRNSANKRSKKPHVVIGECSACNRPIRARAGGLRPEMKLTCKCGATNVIKLSQQFISLAARDPNSPKLSIIVRDAKKDTAEPINPADPE